MKNKKKLPSTATNRRASRRVEENLQSQGSDEDRAINERFLFCDYRMIMCTILILVMPSPFLDVEKQISTW